MTRPPQVKHRGRSLRLDHDGAIDDFPAQLIKPGLHLRGDDSVIKGSEGNAVLLEAQRPDAGPEPARAYFADEHLDGNIYPLGPVADDVAGSKVALVAAGPCRELV